MLEPVPGCTGASARTGHLRAYLRAHHTMVFRQVRRVSVAVRKYPQVARLRSPVLAS